MFEHPYVFLVKTSKKHRHFLAGHPSTLTKNGSPWAQHGGRSSAWQLPPSWCCPRPDTSGTGGGFSPKLSDFCMKKWMKMIKKWMNIENG